jgi:hypothetical protein
LNEGLIGQKHGNKTNCFDTTRGSNSCYLYSTRCNQKYVLITPFILDNKTIGVIEIGKFTDFSGNRKGIYHSFYGYCN